MLMASAWVVIAPTGNLARQHPKGHPASESGKRQHDEYDECE